MEQNKTSNQGARSRSVNRGVLASLKGAWIGFLIQS